LDLLDFDCQVANQPHSTYDQPVVLWSDIGFERYWLGVLPLHVGYLFKTGYYKEPEASPSRDLPRIWLYEEKQIKYISEDERGGFKVAKVNFPLSEGRLRLFLRGRKIG
jgi:hypothetical protein